MVAARERWRTVLCVTATASVTAPDVRRERSHCECLAFEPSRPCASTCRRRGAPIAPSSLNALLPSVIEHTVQRSLVRERRFALATAFR